MSLPNRSRTKHRRKDSRRGREGKLPRSRLLLAEIPGLVPTLEQQGQYLQGQNKYQKQSRPVLSIPSRFLSSLSLSSHPPCISQLRSSPGPDLCKGFQRPVDLWSRVCG